jgi:hypothetical protein
MTAESILERISQNPFRPIAVKTTAGTRIEINQAEDIFIYDRMIYDGVPNDLRQNGMKTTCVVLFDSVGTKFIYELEQIAAIEVR